MAEGLLKQHLKQSGLERLVKVDSAGTHGDMQGSRADERACKVALIMELILDEISRER